MKTNEFAGAAGQGKVRATVALRQTVADLAILFVAGRTVNIPVREYHIHMERAHDVDMTVSVRNKKDEIKQDTRPTTDLDATLPLKVSPLP